MTVSAKFIRRVLLTFRTGRSARYGIITGIAINASNNKESAMHQWQSDLDTFGDDCRFFFFADVVMADSTAKCVIAP